jgi:lipopolysaccharide/colanic/teichoic acid biosynthesis glycosyltransferase
MNRFLNLLFVIFILVILSIPILFLMVVVRAKLGSPIFFKQMRPGLNGEPFLLIKFRTMIDLYDLNGEMLPDSLRLNAFGRFLRSTSMDELPELWNVFKGEMSLVGPRPLLMEYLEIYSIEQARRHDVLPGITGWAQVNGRNAISWDDKFKLDIWYVNNRSLWLDVKILFLTVRKVLFRDGITAHGEATMPKFRG